MAELHNIKKVDFKVVKLPEIFIEENRGFRLCCPNYVMQVRASTELDSWKNDKTGAFVETGTLGSVVFKLFKDGVDLSYSFTVLDLPNQTTVKTTVLDWRVLLLAHGVGCYELKVVGSISGISFDYTYGKYNLLIYSPLNVRKQVRLRSQFDKYFQSLNIDFRGSGFTDDIRLEGFFGKMQPKTVINNLVYSDRTQRPITYENVKTYEFTSRLLRDVELKQLYDFHLLGGTVIFATDYNMTNTDYSILDLPVIVSKEGNGLQIDYIDGNRLATASCLFEKKLLNDKSFRK
jgi:hypothetical protein